MSLYCCSELATTLHGAASICSLIQTTSNLLTDRQWHLSCSAQATSLNSTSTQTKERIFKRGTNSGWPIAPCQASIKNQQQNRFRRTQQVGECFDNFLVSLRELTKTCNFCNNDCLQKALRDQIIEGLLDGEIIQELLQVKDLTLDQAITMCRGLEAAKKSRHKVQGSPEVSTFRMQHGTGTCQGCGAPFHDGGRKRCPAYNQTCHKCGKTGHFSRVCRQKNPPSRSDHKTVPHANALSTGELPLVRLSELANRTVSPAPTVNMQVSTCHGQASLDILPDSGADICAAGPQFVQALGEHMQNLADSYYS